MTKREEAAGIQVLVVDDEPLARRNLVLLLRAAGGIAAISECESGMQAIEQIRESKPDLVFLDVQMPECGGFDVLEMLGSEMPPIIFVTAYDEYALRAFEAGALDYLLKPFDDSRFARALKRARERLAHGATPRPAAKKLVVKNRGQTIFLDAADVDWVEAAGYYACVHVGRDTHIIRRSLTELAQDLGDETFARIHRSTLVNLGRVRGFEMQDGGEYAVVLKSGDRLPLSRRFRKPLQQRLGMT